MKIATLCLSVMLMAAVAGCGASAGVGYGIPGTPVSVGVSVPLDQRGQAKSSAKTAYRQVQVETVPAGAQVQVNGALVGSSPMLVTVPFERGWFGAAKGTAQLLVRKGGYLPEGVTLFPSGQGVSRTPNGQAESKLVISLRAQ